MPRPRIPRTHFAPGPRGDVFHAVADPTRRRLLDLLGAGDKPVNTLAAPFPMTRPAVSQHLRILRHAGLVGMRRSGREHYYRLRARRLREVYDWVAHYQRFWRDKLAALRHYLDRTENRQSQPRDKSTGENS